MSRLAAVVGTSFWTSAMSLLAIATIRYVARASIPAPQNGWPPGGWQSQQSRSELKPEPDPAFELLRGPEGAYQLLPESKQEADLLRLGPLRDALAMGEVRSGHPEGILGLHVQRQWEFIDRAALPRRGELRLIALLHDLAKNFPSGDGNHAERSARFAEEKGVPRALVEVVRVHDENWYALQRWKRSEGFNLAAFVARYEGIDMDLLVPFKYADNCDRELVPVFWMEHHFVAAGLYETPYYRQNPAVISENNVVRGVTPPY